MAAQILLVDDNPTNLQVLYQTLQGHGYRLLAARRGKDAIAIAERDGTAKPSADLRSLIERGGMSRPRDR